MQNLTTQKSSYINDLSILKRMLTQGRPSFPAASHWNISHRNANQYSDGLSQGKFALRRLDGFLR